MYSPPTTSQEHMDPLRLQLIYNIYFYNVYVRVLQLYIILLHCIMHKMYNKFEFEKGSRDHNKK